MRRQFVDNTPETSIDQLAALQELDRQLREKTELMRASEGELAEVETQLAQQRELAGACRWSNGDDLPPETGPGLA